MSTFQHVNMSTGGLTGAIKNVRVLQLQAFLEPDSRFAEPRPKPRNRDTAKPKTFT